MLLPEYNNNSMLQGIDYNNKQIEPPGLYKGSLTFLFIFIGGAYLIWRSGTLGTDLPALSWAIYLAEIYGYISALLHIFMCWNLTVRQPPPPAEGMTVDVFVPTYNEPADLVRRTILAAKNMDYPHTTWLLDDGNRTEIKELAGHLGVNYLARGNNENAKAGNLNHALANSSGEFIAVFDADHAPQKRFLTSTLGYFKDEKVAFVQTPQDFFNLDSYQHRVKHDVKRLWTEQSLFFKIIQRGKDWWNAAFFCGSCAVIRRSALVSIGGFATGTITEDLHTSLRLHKAGFKSVYHGESLAFGIAPGNITPFLKQRVRWGQGAMQVLRQENIFFTRKLTFAQKLNYLASIMTYFDGWQKGLFYFAPAFVLVTGIAPIEANGMVFLAWFLPYYILSLLVFEEIGRGYGGLVYIAQYNFARFAAFAWATMGLFRKHLKFEVTSKSLSRNNALQWMFLPQFVAIVFNALAIPLAIVLAIMTEDHIRNDILMFNVVWSGLNVGLGIAIVSFTRKIGRFIRTDYRFPVPLPMKIHAGSSYLPVTIDNLSSTGCRIYGKLPEGAKKGEVIHGKLALPSGDLPVKAQVITEINVTVGETTYLKAIGCRFLWGNPEDRNSLDLFLYGNDLQLRLLELDEQSRTPAAWLRDRIKRIRFPRHNQDRWAICEITSLEAGSTTSMHGLVPLPSDGSSPRKIVTFDPIGEHSLVSIGIFTRTGQNQVYSHIGNVSAIDNSLGSVFLHSLKPAHKPDFITLNNPLMDAKCETMPA